MEIVGDYEYNRKDLIGHGAFAVVFKGRNRKRPDNPVAIKSITKKNLAKSQNLLSKEIKILKELSDLHHENVVALLDCKETTNHVYLVMEYCNGGDLADYLQVKGTLSEETIAAFLRQIAAAMKALNAKGIVHRDLKPQNILLCHSGKPNPQASEMRLKIADFGFARFLNDGVMAATLCGSPMYMAPEVIMSLQYDAKADLWSIGTIVFQCLKGKAPFQAQTPQQLKHFYEKHAELKPNIPKDTSPELRDLLLKMLKRNAKDRIDFEDFFIHPFLKPPSPSPSSASSPVPVPGRSSQGCSSESPTPPRCVSASPLSGKVQYSPPPFKPPIAKPEDLEPMQTSQEPNGFEKIEKDNRCDSPAGDDFVLVPGGLQGDNSDNSDRSSGEGLKNTPSPSHRATISPKSKTVKFLKTEEQTSPNRPSSLPMHVGQGGSSEPIPVPTQVNAYKRIKSGGSFSSPPKDMDISPSSSAKDMDRKSSLSKASCAVDVGSMSPPAVKFSIGTPPSYAGYIRKNSIGASPGTNNNVSPSNSPHRRNINRVKKNLWQQRSKTETNIAENLSGGSSFLAEQLRRAVINSQQGSNPGAVMQYGSLGSLGSSRERLSSPIKERCGSYDSDRSGLYLQKVANSPSPPMLFAQSPPNMQGPVAFIAPGLNEETLMDDNHNETMGKLSFVNDLVSCVMELAQSRGGPLHSLAESVSLHQGEQLQDQPPRFTEAQRRLEQLVLYVRALHLLSSSLQLAQKEIKSERLQVSKSLKTVLKEMNANYHKCLSVCKHIQQRMGTAIQTALTPQLLVATADKLIYNHAIEMCQTAALDELFGNPQECFRRYQSAHILLHSLSQQARNVKDRYLINKYKDTVERRLTNIQSTQTFMHPYETPVS
ncbi:serine/threonine-protein kinase unc-51-like isoform X2 [Mytilus galloprovincialis]|uniref:serine/threonine-protein kinase unc-51-like isoform X2 n=1 Tax=Mytilus galloprovincialis TaxID=29158 RepID=UPI003F7B8CB4